MSIFCPAINEIAGAGRRFDRKQRLSNRVSAIWAGSRKGDCLFLHNMRNATVSRRVGGEKLLVPAIRPITIARSEYVTSELKVFHALLLSGDRCVIMKNRDISSGRRPCMP